ncbi:cytochrome P450 monooxygenase oxidoreductase [Fusarium sp. NRRL 52700]|nr:cytochrome P450 monooxygenase oxidoreductase [Fusarium sp. NRRL 52700]
MTRDGQNFLFGQRNHLMGFKVADKTERFIRAACTLPLEEGFTRPGPRDLSFDYRAFTNFFTLEAIADIGLSERLGFLDQGHDRVKAERMDGTIHEVNFRECLHSTARAQSILAWTEKCEANPPGLEWGEIVAEVSITMNAMDWLLKKIVAPYDKFKHLPYLRACLDELLRIRPPTTFGFPRRTPPEGWNILGDHIPGDTTVSISAYVAHRDPQVFPDLEPYAPERWLGEKSKNLQPYFIAFSAGARGCIGRNINHLEQTVLLASIVHRYEWALPYPEWEPERREAMTLAPGPMPLKVWRRDLGVEEVDRQRS